MYFWIDKFESYTNYSIQNISC